MGLRIYLELAKDFVLHAEEYKALFEPLRSLPNDQYYNVLSSNPTELSYLAQVNPYNTYTMVQLLGKEVGNTGYGLMGTSLILHTCVY